MSALPPDTLRASALRMAVLLGCAAAGCAHADSDRETLGVVSSVDLPAQAKGNPPSWTGRAFRQGVVTAANPFGAEAGAKILEQGGNAIDAAVAVAYALNVVEPQSAGIGGGGFMMIHLAATGQTITIDSREKAPAGARRDMFVGMPTTTPPVLAPASLSGVAVGVPGMVRGTELALQRYGRLSLAQVLQPAIELADNGFAATRRFVTSPSCAGTDVTSRAKNSPLSAEYFCPGGQQIPENTLVTNKALAETFRLIATHGADCFYKLDLAKGCDIAQGIVEGQTWTRPQAAGGRAGSMTLADLEAYQPVLREPIEGSYRGYKIKSMAPPSSGALTVIQILKMLERFPLGDASKGYGFGSVNTLNVMADAMRLAFADRGVWMADADFVPVPTKGLIDDTYLSGRGAPITAGTRLLQQGVPPTQQGTLLSSDPRPFETAGLEHSVRLAVAEPGPSGENGTTHFSVVDKWGNVVSYTNTIESGYGIGVFAGYKKADGSFRNHGFLLNNELTDFNTQPSTNPWTGGFGFNDVQANKRPRSSMAPTMLFSPQGKPIVAYGSPGGATIINSVVNLTVNLIDHKMGLQDAVDAARISVAGAGSTIQLENRFTNLPALQQALGPSGLGYTVNVGDVGSVQAVLIDQQTGKQYGAADNRREGTVIGLPRPRGQ
ncbi:MAG: gamma-glutamyltransferase [Burkholderiaceae bacterium]|jgi:gamma-glutamyltranspeptidase/glutathione hydrolase|nr:gamma-glutamyltransferase [Burkholderiaceae bacterium]